MDGESEGKRRVSEQRDNGKGKAGGVEREGQ